MGAGVGETFVSAESAGGWGGLWWAEQTAGCSVAALGAAALDRDRKAAGHTVVEGVEDEEIGAVECMEMK